MRASSPLAALLLLCALKVQDAHSQGRSTPPELRKYDVPHTPTLLEWKLLFTNQAYANSFPAGSGQYISSGQVIWRADRGVFFSAFTVYENRSLRDEAPFSMLPELRQQAVLQEGVDHLLSILSIEFPEVKTSPRLLEVEFWYASQGSTLTIARYQGGRLTRVR